ncbi:MAG: tetratricopeptide repeat-containing sensor histidine kinase [Marinilabiliaceae bacterium]|nr:tetratricopeptide repeat-containing sensor histidine kinase [Marinilabiliaceae bacterium]
MKRILLIALLFTASCYFFGQNLDSLYIAYKDAPSGERRQAGDNIVQWFAERQYLPDSTLLDKNLPEAEFDRNLLSLTVRYLLRFEHYSLTFDASQYLLKLSESANDTTNMIIAYYFMGFSNQRMGKMDEGLIYAIKCYELCLAHNDVEMTSSVTNNIANIYQTNHQDSIAIVYFKKSIAIERKLGRMQNLAIRLGNISTSYLRLGRLDEALSSATEGLELDRKEGRPDRIAIRLHQLGDVYSEMENFVKAKECGLEALDYFVKSGSKYGQSIVLDGLGKIEQRQRNLKNAENYFLKALSIAEEIQNNLLVQRVCTNLYELFKTGNNYEQSLFYFERSAAIKDSLFHVENQQLLSEFQVRYETAEKEIEIIRQQSEINSQEVRLKFVIGSLIVATLILALLVFNINIRTRRNRELTEINATKDKIFNIISHDLKNPAIGQRNALQFLSDNVNEWDRDKIADFSLKLCKSSESILDLIKNLLYWSRLQTGKKIYHNLPFNLVKALKPDINVIDSMAEQKGVNFKTIIPPAVIINGDENMILTVIRNLLANAVKFTNKEGNITLKIENKQDDKTEKVIISISDTGVGMTDTQIQNLFHSDFQQSTIGTEGESGSGLGLIVCDELLQKHNSKLHIESEIGKGSKFWFEL